MPGVGGKVGFSSKNYHLIPLRILLSHSEQQFLVLISCFQGGRLGLGTEEDVCTPKEVKMNKQGWGGGGGLTINDDNNVEVDYYNAVIFAGEAEHG